MDYQADITDMASQNLQFYYFGHQECLPGHAYGPAVRDHYLLKYIKKGKGVYRINNETHVVHEKSFYFLFPGEPAYYKADEEDPWEYFWIGFHGLMAKNLLHSVGITPANPVIKSSNPESIEKLFENFRFRKPINDDVDELFHTGILNLIMSEILREAGYGKSPSTDEKENLKVNYVRRAVKFMQMNYVNNISVASVADYLSLDRTYFSKLFKQVKKTTPQEFLTALRLLKAKSLLLQSTMPLDTVSASSGFKNAFYFSAAFKKATGMTPTQFRKA